MASEVGICNLALQKLGAESISSLTEDSRNARAVNACYAEMRDAEISAHPWSFARTRATLTASATTPDFEFTYQFTLPVGALRLQLPRQAGLEWELEGGAIPTNDGTTIEMVYYQQITDPNAMPPSFRNALACRIAAQTCEQITQSTTKWEKVMKEYDFWIA